MTFALQDLSKRDAALLRIVADLPGVTPSTFAYEALRRGLLVNRTGRRWRAQGAGRIGGGELARLEKARLIYGHGNYGRNFKLTTLGRSLLIKFEAANP